MTDARHCPFEDDVLVLTDGVLDPVRRMVVEAHLAVCSSCAEIEESMESAAAALRAEPCEPLGSADAALARIAAPPRIGMRIAAAAALCIASVALAAYWSRRGAAPDANRERPATSPIEQVAPDSPTVVESSLRAESPTADADPPDDAEPPIPEGPPARYIPRSLDDLPGLVAAVDADAPDDDAALAATVRRVRTAGTVGASALADLLESGDRDALRSALRVARAAPSAQSVSALARLLDDEELGPRAARILGSIATGTAVEALVRSLDGPSRDAALDALATCRSPRVFDALAARARSGDDTDLAGVLGAAVTVSPAPAARLLIELSASEDSAPAAARVLRSRRDELSPALITLAARNDALVATPAIRALGIAGDTAAIPALRSAAHRFSLARHAVRALVALGTPEAFAAAFDAAADPRAPHGLLDAFGGVAAATPTLLRELGDPRASAPRRRLAAIEALGHAGDLAAVQPLSRVLPEAPLRRAVVEALGRIGGDDAAAVLAGATDPRTADDALVRALGNTESSVAVPALIALTREPALASAAATALGRIDDAESVLALADLLAEPRTARSASQALGAMPAAVVVPPLLGRLDDPAGAGRARRALVLVSGADLGRDAAAWRHWWDGRRPRTPERHR